jgi:hypothetical protein
MHDSLLVLRGYCTIQLWRKISGSNRWPHTRKWGICGNVLVDEDDFQELNHDTNGEEFRWLRSDGHSSGSYCAIRCEKINGEWITVYMSREILGLSYGGGHGYGHWNGEGDHKNHDTRDNRKENLRDATVSQNRMNKRKYGSNQLPKGVYKAGKGYHTKVTVDRLRVWFPVLPKKNEVWFMRKEAEKHVQGDFACSEDIPDDQMPTEERQKWLRELVLDKLRKNGLIQSKE